MTYPPNTYPQQAAPARKRRRWPWVLVGLVVLFGVCGGVGIAALAGGAKAVKDSTDKPHTITYTISGPGTAMVTYIGDGFSESQDTEAKLPWTKTITVKGWQPVTVNAQLGIGVSGTISCEIDVDGVKGKPVSSHGQSAVVMCSDDTMPTG